MADPNRSHLSTRRDSKIRLTHSANKSLDRRLSFLHLEAGNQDEHKYVYSMTS